MFSIKSLVPYTCMLGIMLQIVNFNRLYQKIRYVSMALMVYKPTLYYILYILSVHFNSICWQFYFILWKNNYYEI